MREIFSCFQFSFHHQEHLRHRFSYSFHHNNSTETVLLIWFQISKGISDIFRNDELLFTSPFYSKTNGEPTNSSRTIFQALILSLILNHPTKTNCTNTTVLKTLTLVIHCNTFSLMSAQARNY